MNKHVVPRKNPSPPPSRPKKKDRSAAVLRAGWIFLGAVIVLVIVVLLVVLFSHRKSAGSTSASSSAETAVVTATAAPVVSHPDGNGGNTVKINGIRCTLDMPESLTFGVLTTIDLSGSSETIASNVQAAGWGTVRSSISDDGALVLTGEDSPSLDADAYDRQEEFLASSQPEAMARTFLDNSGLIPILQNYGITLNNEVENNNGEITFRGTGDNGSECSIVFTFLYTGSFRQARIRLTALTDTVTTSDIVPMTEAASQAISWSSPGTEETAVTAASLRYIRGLPFYVFTCDDGTTAYALAVTQDALSQSPSAAAVYDELMATGIQEYTETAGTA